MRARPAWQSLDLLDPRAEHFDLADIALALSRTYRFHGMSALTVAQHSVYVSKACPREHAVAGLLADSAEAYLADCPTPVKHSPGWAGYRRLEAKYLLLLAER